MNENLESTFDFIGENESIEFIKSLNLTEEQYLKLAEIMEKHGDDEFERGMFIDSPGESW